MSELAITFDLSQFVQLQAAIAAQPERVREELHVATVDSNMLLQGELQQRLPRGAGGAAGLAGSIATREERLENQVIGVVFTDRAYAVPVELGTRPHPVSPAGVASLMDWVQAKLGISEEREVKSVAYLIARKIRTRGTPAQPVWRTVWEAKRDEVARKFGAAIARVLEAFAP